MAVKTALFTLERSYRRIVKYESDANSFKTKLDAMESTKPKIKLKEPGAIYTEPIVQSFRGTSGQLFKQRVDTFLKVRFINDPQLSVPSSKATGVIATIDYHRCSDGEHLLSLDGRWSESTQPSAISPLESTVHLLSADFSQGQQRSLDIAFCDGETGKCYAWNNDNYKAANQLFVYPPHLLTGDTFKVTIRLRGNSVDERFEFTFNITSDKGFKIE